MNQKKNKLQEDWVRLTKKLLKEDIEDAKIVSDHTGDENTDYNAEIKKLDDLIIFFDKKCNQVKNLIFATSLGNLIDNDFAELEGLKRKVDELENGQENIYKIYHKLDDQLSDLRETDGITPEQDQIYSNFISQLYKVYMKSDSTEKKVRAMSNLLHKIGSVMENDLDDDDFEMIKKLAK